MGLYRGGRPGRVLVTPPGSLFIYIAMLAISSPLTLMGEFAILNGMDEPRDIRVTTMMSKTEVSAIDRWRAQQPDVPNRSEAIRRLVERGLRRDDG